jgi:(5-formylfuran-3-yl)methyl phosphate synthase
MTGFLASVNCLEEADIALQAGADVIDLKEPARGVLGAVPVSTLRTVVKFIAGQRLMSATVGDLPSDPAVFSQAVAEIAATGVDIVKVGLFDRVHRSALFQALAAQAQSGARLVVVLFADREPEPETVLVAIAEGGLMGVMLDTADKQGGSLRDCCSDSQLAGFVKKGKELGLVTGLAGSLRNEDIEPLLHLGPDYLGFRGALCSDRSRYQAIDPVAVKYVRTQIPLEDRCRVG